jgi:hypothetical protein
VERQDDSAASERASAEAAVEKKQRQAPLKAPFIRTDCLNYLMSLCGKVEFAADESASAAGW